MSPDALPQEAWRLVTSALPHLDILHLVFNLYWLWALGTAIESVTKHLRFLLLVILLSAGSTLAEFSLLEGGVGLSGVGYGLFGYLWALRRDPRYEGAIDRRTADLFVGWFFLCIVLTYANVWQVGNVAHASGAAIGYMVGRAVGTAPPHRLRWQGACIATMGLLVAATVAYPRLNLGMSRANRLAALGYQALAANRNDQAAALLEEAVKLDPIHAESWANLGLARLRREQWEESLTAFEQASQLNPTVDPAREGAVSAAVQSAYQSSQSQHFAEAESVLRRAMKTAPRSAQLWLYLGYVLHSQDRSPEAAKAFERALELDPKLNEAWERLQSLRTSETPQGPG